jgi:hypothetical protein
MEAVEPHVALAERRQNRVTPFEINIHIFSIGVTRFSYFLPLFLPHNPNPDNPESTPICHRPTQTYTDEYAYSFVMPAPSKYPYLDRSHKILYTIYQLGYL